MQFRGVFYTCIFVGVCVLFWRESMPYFINCYTQHTSATDYCRNILPLSAIPNTDQMPFHEYIRSREELQRAEWMRKLYQFLQTLDKRISPQVNMVFGDSNHTHLVLNWLTAALTLLHPPLHNVMVLSLDHALCDFLTGRGLPVTCIAVPVASIFTLGDVNGWREGILVRFPILRLINYWGYDVAAYDSDAVLLRNPQELYDDKPHVHLFSSAGTFPPLMAQEWGFTLCGGTLVFRASPVTEVLWSYICAEPFVKSDQAYLNGALYKMNLTSTWNTKSRVGKICTVEEGWAGGRGINIFVFPQHQFCRRCCAPNMPHESLYLVHPICDKIRLHKKVQRLQEMGVWFLDKEHNNIILT